MAVEPSPEAQEAEDELWLAIGCATEAIQIEIAERLMAEGFAVVALSRTETPDWVDSAAAVS